MIILVKNFLLFGQNVTLVEEIKVLKYKFYYHLSWECALLVHLKQTHEYTPGCYKIRSEKIH
jgi:hypothetical protein